MENTIFSLQKTARIAGLVYFIIIITSVLSLIFGPYHLMMEGDIKQSIENIRNDQGIYRLGMAYEMLMYSAVIFLSVLLFQLLKKFGFGVAISALLFRFGEAIMGFLMVAASFIGLYIINSDISEKSTQEILSIIFKMKDFLMLLLMEFIAVGSLLFLYLFFKSNYIPNWLIVLGIISFASIFLESLVQTIYPMKAWVFPGSLAVLFEIIIGLWLMIKGIRIEK